MKPSISVFALFTIVISASGCSSTRDRPSSAASSSPKNQTAKSADVASEYPGDGVVKDPRLTTVFANLREMAAAAKRSFERERSSATLLQDDSAEPEPAHAFCASASPTPAAIPRGKAVTPSAEPGKDFMTGDERTGWKCLGYAPTADLICQYSYTVGPGGRAPARGQYASEYSFEVAAECDLDGDGQTALYSLIGNAGSEAGPVRIATEFGRVNEGE
ncbi:MAG: hypothetical protein U0271_17705 [Polyangiaceae bacterium]